MENNGYKVKCTLAYNGKKSVANFNKERGEQT